MTVPTMGRELRSLAKPGMLELSIQQVEVAAPGPGEVIVRIEAAPINPSDQPLLLGPADLSTLTSDGGVTVAIIPDAASPLIAARVGKSLPAGNEGAGVVVSAGEGAEHLLGKVVGVLGGAMYTQYRRARAADVLVFAQGITPAQGASAFVNPLTALGMVETTKREGHTALVHTAAASNLGQMLNKVCIADDIALVNIVRNEEQAAILRAIGAKHVIDSSAPDFRETLTLALVETGATIAFDAVGGGPLAGHILGAMEAALVRKVPPVGGYGSPVHKQVYIYGRLDLSPTTLPPNAGFAWGIGGFLLTPFLMKIGPEGVEKLRQRVADEILTTFASHYTSEISLTEAIEPDMIRRWQRKATGEKYLINPSKDG